MLAYLKGWEWGTHWPLGTRQSSHTSLNPTNQPALHPDQPYIFKLLHYVINGILFALILSILPVIQMHQHEMHQDTSIASVGSYLRWHPNWIKSYPTFIGWLCIRNMSNICNRGFARTEILHIVENSPLLLKPWRSVAISCWNVESAEFR